MAGRRTQARRYAVLALYQWQVSGQSPAEISRHFFDDPAWMDEIADALCELGEQAPGGADRVCDLALFQTLLLGVPERVETLDERLAEVLDRPLAQVTPVDLAILRMAVFELLTSPEVPYRVVINEAVELAKEFGSTDDTHRYVNGVLDRIAHRLRTAETGAGSVAGSGPSAPCPSST
jgi:N utilization substance protein B